MEKILLLALFFYISLARANSSQTVIMCQNLKIIGYSVHASMEESEDFEIINAHKYFLELEHRSDKKTQTKIRINTGSQIKEYIIKNDCDIEYQDVLEIE